MAHRPCGDVDIEDRNESASLVAHNEIGCLGDYFAPGMSPEVMSNPTLYRTMYDKLLQIQEKTKTTRRLFFEFVQQRKDIEQHLTPKEKSTRLLELLADQREGDTLGEDWTHLVENSFQPYNREVKDSLRELHVEYGLNLPGFYHEFTSHIAEMDMLVRKWRQGNFRTRQPHIFYPNDIHAWVESRLAFVLKRHMEESARLGTMALSKIPESSEAIGNGCDRDQGEVDIEHKLMEQVATLTRRVELMESSLPKDRQLSSRPHAIEEHTSEIPNPSRPPKASLPPEMANWDAGQVPPQVVKRYASPRSITPPTVVHGSFAHAPNSTVPLSVSSVGYGQAASLNSRHSLTAPVMKAKILQHSAPVSLSVAPQPSNEPSRRTAEQHVPSQVCYTYKWLQR